MFLKIFLKQGKFYYDKNMFNREKKIMNCG